MKNSASGPKIDGVADARSTSGRPRPSWRAARVAVVGLAGVGLEHVAEQAQRLLGEERIDVGRVGSGISVMSDSLIAFQPAIEEPSNIRPSAKVLVDSVTSP
jgi:hypothetical protein